MMKLKKGNLLIFGLSDGNIERLKNNEPIKFNLQELGLQDMDIIILSAKDEDTMYQMFKGQIDPLKTIFKDDRATKHN